MVRLHGGDYFLAAEARNFIGAQMLSVLDAEAMVARSVLFGSLFVNIQDSEVGFIADRMNHHLQPRFISPLDPLEHYSFGQHLIEKQPPSVRGVIIRLEEKS